MVDVSRLLGTFYQALLTYILPHFVQITDFEIFFCIGRNAKAVCKVDATHGRGAAGGLHATLQLLQSRQYLRCVGNSSWLEQVDLKKQITSYSKDLGGGLLNEVVNATRVMK